MFGIFYFLHFTIMSELLQTRKITEDKQKQLILQVIADKSCIQILYSLLYVSKSTNQIVIDENISKSTAYNRLQMLFAAKLVSLSGMISKTGNKCTLYKSRVKSITVKCDLDEVIIEIESNKIQNQ